MKHAILTGKTGEADFFSITDFKALIHGYLLVFFHVESCYFQRSQTSVLATARAHGRILPEDSFPVMRTGKQPPVGPQRWSHSLERSIPTSMRAETRVSWALEIIHILFIWILFICIFNQWLCDDKAWCFASHSQLLASPGFKNIYLSQGLFLGTTPPS